MKLWRAVWVAVEEVVVPRLAAVATAGVVLPRHALAALARPQPVRPCSPRAEEIIAGIDQIAGMHADAHGKARLRPAVGHHALNNLCGFQCLPGAGPCRHGAIAQRFDQPPAMAFDQALHIAEMGLHRPAPPCTAHCLRQNAAVDDICDHDRSHARLAEIEGEDRCGLYQVFDAARRNPMFSM